MSSFLQSLFDSRRVHELTAQLRQRGELVDQLERQLIEVRHSTITLSNRLRETELLIQDLELLLEEAREKEQRLEEDLRGERTARARQEQELSAERAAREASDVELRGEIGRLLDVVREAHAALAQRDEEARAERSARETSESELRQEIGRLLDALRESHAALAQKDQEARAEQSARAAAEAELRALIDSIASRGDTAHQAAREALGDLERIKGALQTAQSELAGERRARNAKEAEAAALHAELAARTAGNAELENKLAELTRQHGELTEAFRAISAQMQTLSLESAEQDKQAIRAREELAHSAARRAELEASLRLEEAATQSALASLAAAEAALQKEREARAQLEQQLRGRIDGLIERRDAIKGLVQSTSTELERVRAALQLAERELVAERDLRRTEVAAVRSTAKASDQSRMETKALLREAHEALRAERDVTRGLREALDRETSERARLVQGLASSAPARRSAALEETIHQLLARALDIVELVQAEAEPAVQRALIETPDLPLDGAPRRAIVIAAEDPVLREAASAAISTLVGAVALPLAPDAADLDEWLSEALADRADAKVAILPVDAALLSAVAMQTHDRRALRLATLLMRARTLHLVWSDKCLGIAHRQVYGAARSGDTLDDGDARMSVPLYRELIGREQRLQAALARSGLIKASEVERLYAELATAPALVQFCRDGGFAIKPSKLAAARALLDVDEATAAFARRIRAAVELQAAQSEQDRNPLLALARAQERAGRYREAMSTCEDAVREAPGDVAARLMLAAYLELSGRTEEAEAMLRDLAAEDVRAAVALRDLARRLGDDEKVLAAAKTMQQGGAPQGGLAVAAAAAALERTQEARDALSQLAEGAHGEAMQRTETRVALLERLPGLRAAAEHGGAKDWFALGEALRQLDKVEEAAQAYRSAESASPGLLARTCGPGVGPDLLMIGPPRTATTLLRRALELHPGVSLLEGESAFLTNAEPIELEHYLARVAAARARAHGALVGDKSPQHFALSPAHIELAALLFPHARLIVTTREPVERAFSHIKLLGYRRAVEASIAAALGDGAMPRWLADVLDKSRYRKHLKAWLAHYSAERVLVLQSEDFERDMAEACGRLFNWLGLPAPEPEALLRLQRNWSNRTASHPLHPALETLLRNAIGNEAYTVRDLEAAMKKRTPRAAATPR